MKRAYGSVDSLVMPASITPEEITYKEATFARVAKVAVRGEIISTPEEYLAGSESDLAYFITHRVGSGDVGTSMVYVRAPKKGVEMPFGNNYEETTMYKEGDRFVERGVSSADAIPFSVVEAIEARVQQVSGAQG